MIKYFTLLFVLLFLFSCSCKKKIQKREDDKTIENIALKAFGVNHTIDYNSTKEFAFVYSIKEVRKNDPFPTIMFSLVKLNEKKEIFKDIVPGGKIKWINDYEIEVKSLVNRPKDILNSTSNTLYILNVKTLTKHR